jgi:hypothetical protein
MLIEKFTFKVKAVSGAFQLVVTEIMFSVHQTASSVIDGWVNSGTSVAFINAVIMTGRENFIDIKFQTIRNLKPPNREMINDNICPFKIFCFIDQLNRH